MFNEEHSYFNGHFEFLIFLGFLFFSDLLVLIADTALTLAEHVEREQTDDNVGREQTDDNVDREQTDDNL